MSNKAITRKEVCDNLKQTDEMNTAMSDGIRPMTVNFCEDPAKIFTLLINGKRLPAEG